jgi:hypothetical protein
LAPRIELCFDAEDCLSDYFDENQTKSSKNSPDKMSAQGALEK